MYSSHVLNRGASRTCCLSSHIFFLEESFYCPAHSARLKAPAPATKSWCSLPFISLSESAIGIAAVSEYQQHVKQPRFDDSTSTTSGTTHPYPRNPNGGGRADLENPFQELPADPVRVWLRISAGFCEILRSPTNNGIKSPAETPDFRRGSSESNKPALPSPHFQASSALAPRPRCWTNACC